VRLRRDRVVVILEYKVYVYGFSDLKLLHQIDTESNPMGLCALSPASSATVLSCPGIQRGQVRIELYDIKRTKFVTAHSSKVYCLALSLDGKRLATASEKGTLVRIYDTQDAQLLHELRRGAEYAKISSLAFSPEYNWLAVASDKTTIHVFALADQAKAHAMSPQPLPGASHGTDSSEDMSQSTPQNQKTAWPGFMKGILPKYFSSEWSFAQFRLPESKTETAHVVAFGSTPNTFYVACGDGSFYVCSFDPEVPEAR